MKVAHKLAFLDEMLAAPDLRPGRSRAILVGDLNVAPLEHDVWVHRQLLKVVSHTPVECAKLTAVQRAGAWFDVLRAFVPEPRKLYTWWSYRGALTGKLPIAAGASITSGPAPPLPTGCRP